MTDYTMQSSKGFNPFLMESDYAAAPAPPPPEPMMYTAPAPDPSSNPFLSFGAPPAVAAAEPPMFASGGGMGDNPFLSYAYQAPPEEAAMTMMAPPPTTASTGSHNPFADFGAPAAGGVISGGANAYFACAADMSYAHQTHEPEHPQLIDTSDAPTRQSTQSLLEHVTGALEATSDSLLDRLRVTAPSPTPELPSPTPSPRSPSPDLLLGEEPPPPPPPSANPLQPSPHQLDSIIDLFDSPNPPAGPKSSAEILGLYNTMTVTTAKPAVPVHEVASQPMVIQSLVDFTIEPATPKLFDDQPEEVEASFPPPPPEAPQESVTTSSVPTSPPREVVAVVSEEKVPDHHETMLSPEAPHPQRPPKPPSPVRQVPPPIPPEPVKPPPPAAAAAAVVTTSPTAVTASPARAAPPERPKPPPVPAPPVVKSPVHEANKPSPSRPPPPVPPAPRVSPLPPPVPPSPVVQPHVEHPPPPVPPSPVVQPHVEHPPPVPSEPPPSIPTHPPPPVVSPPAQTFTPQPPKPQQQQFGSTGADIFGTKPHADSFTSAPRTNGVVFDDFDAKFEKLAEGDGGKTGASAFNDPFGGGSGGTATGATDSAWGDSFGGGGDAGMGFGTDDTFDSFLSLTEPPPVPQSTPAKIQREGEDFDNDDEEEREMSITIRPRNENDFNLTLAPALAPPPKSPAISTGSAYSEENSTPAFVPFLSSAHDTTYAEASRQTQMNRTDSGESPQTPLYEEDTSQPLEDFPRTKYTCEGWEMQIRYPNKKKITGNRFWKKVWVRIGHQNDIPIIQIYGEKGNKEPIQEIPLQPSYSVSDISAQQFDQYGKIFTIKIQYVFYKERPGVRPGQISKAVRLSNKLSAFAAYAITGDHTGVKEFGSDLKKLGLPLEHAPQISELCKLGTQEYDTMKQFSVCIEEALFSLPVHRDRALNYKTEEIQVTIVDEYFTEQDVYGMVTRQIARVRLFFLSFLNGIAEIEMGVNDLRRQGKEIVGRHDIIPVPTEEWIRMESIEFSNIVNLEEFESTQTIKFKPPDAAYLELMRFRVRPPKHRELPLQVKTTFIHTGQRIEIRSDILVPGFTSRKLGQIPCEDVMVRFPIPETWIYMFRVEKHFRYGSVKSAHRRSGKVKGVERILGALDAVEPSLMETTSGQAKYEHQHRAIVWRIPRLPKEGQGAYTTHSFFCHITLQAHEKIPDNLSKVCYVEFTMPHTTISHTVCRSISVPTSDEPPEKCCRYLSRHEYVVEIEHKEGMTPATYSVAAVVPAKEEPPPPPPEETKPPADDSDFSDD